MTLPGGHHGTAPPLASLHAPLARLGRRRRGRFRRLPGIITQPATFDLSIVAMALVVHATIGVVLGVVLGAIVAPFRLDSDVVTVSVAGAVFGLAVYAVNFYVMTQLFPWFIESRGWTMLAGHVIFGAFAGYMYWILRQMDEPSASR
ncbi:hypothetical protein [Pandoraea pnomenusa]|uniref:hypothetical protein n=1 Tax=Pandoraea pnomenusa TaxID=93220 RepID=UPI00311A15CA